MAPCKLLVLISGSGSNLQAIMDACASGQINGDVVGVISNKSDAYGLVRAANAGIKTAVLSHKDFSSREEYDAQLTQLIASFSPDLVVLAGFMRILTKDLVQTFKGKMLNIHPSLLPKYQGLNTHQRAIAAGDSEHGVSVHFVTEELDGGPVVAQAITQVTAQDTPDTLAAKVHALEHVLYPQVIQWFAEKRLIMVGDHAVLDNKKLPPNGKQSH